MQKTTDVRATGCERETSLPRWYRTVVLLLLTAGCHSSVPLRSIFASTTPTIDRPTLSSLMKFFLFRPVCSDRSFPGTQPYFGAFVMRGAVVLVRDGGLLKAGASKLRGQLHKRKTGKLFHCFPRTNTSGDGTILRWYSDAYIIRCST